MRMKSKLQRGKVTEVEGARVEHAVPEGLPLLLKMSEICQALRLNRTQVTGLILQGRLKAYNVGVGKKYEKWATTPEDIRAFLESQVVKPDSGPPGLPPRGQRSRWTNRGQVKEYVK